MISLLPTTEEFIIALTAQTGMDTHSAFYGEPRLKSYYQVDDVIATARRLNLLEKFLCSELVERSNFDAHFITKDVQGSKTRFCVYWRERGVLQNVGRFETLEEAVREYLKTNSFVRD